MSLLARRVLVLAEDDGLGYVGVARVIGTTPRTVARWAAAETSPRWTQRERLLELAAVVDKLRRLADEPAVMDWLYTPNAMLNYERPADLLQRGEFKNVLGIIDAQGEGVFI